jgi:hypothetical protein
MSEAWTQPGPQAWAGAGGQLALTYDIAHRLPPLTIGLCGALPRRIQTGARSDSTTPSALSELIQLNLF